MENGTLSASDVALLHGNGIDCGNGIWLFGLLMLMGMFNGGFGYGYNGGNGNLATQNDVQRGFDTAALQDQSRDILSAVSSGTAQAVAATNQAKYDNINVSKDIQMALSNQINDVRMMEQNILGQQSQCCCETKQMILEKSADLNMALAAVEQRLSSKMDQDKIEALQRQVDALQLQQAVAGVVRYPMATTYTSGNNPFCGCNTGCGCNNI